MLKSHTTPVVNYLKRSQFSWEKKYNFQLHKMLGLLEMYRQFLLAGPAFLSITLKSLAFLQRSLLAGPT